MTTFKGWKTLGFGLLMVIAPPVLALLGGIDWNSSGLPPWAVMLVGAVVMALRFVTTTPIGKGI